ncbi:MAG: hypothetical protein VZQ55_00150 [Ruminococcus sp.]|nr:hypothetical protein [Ruminococcus sp.]
MKKKYITPEFECFKVELDSVLSSSRPPVAEETVPDIIIIDDDVDF